MAFLLRSRLHSLCSSRSALVSKLLKSPELRLISQRWLAVDALLEDHGISVTDAEGGSNVVYEDESLAKFLKEVQGSTNKLRASLTASSKLLDDHLETEISRFTGLVSPNHEARLSLLQAEGGNTNQTQSDQPFAKHSGKSVGDAWQEMVTSTRSMILKKNVKGLQANKMNTGGSLKAKQNKSQLDAADSDLPRSVELSSKEPLAANTCSVKIARSQGTIQQNMDMRHNLSKDSFLKHKERLSHDSLSKMGDANKVNDRQPSKEGSFNATEGWSDLLKASKPEDSSSQIKNQSRNRHMLPSVTKKSMECSLTRASEDFEDLNYITSKTMAQEKSLFQRLKTSDSPCKQDPSHQASNNINDVPKQSYMVYIPNLPPTSNPSTVKAAMAIHGEVVGFFKKSIGDRLNVYIQFKTAVAMENALASAKLQVGSKTCNILRADNSVFTTVVRLSKVANDTEEQEIRTVCEHYGKVDDVKKRVHGVYDIFYDAKEISNIRSILSSLSEVTLNRSTWLALPAPLLHPSVQKELMNSPEGQSWHDVQVNQAVYRIEAGLDAISVLFQDLKELSAVAREYSNQETF